MPQPAASQRAHIVRLLLVVTMAGVALAGLLWAKSRPPAYLAQIDIVLVAPEGREPENPLAPATEGFVDLAGIVAKSVSGSSAADRDVSQGVTLLGQGMRTGWLVRQPNEGNQWVYNFDRPVLSVQAAGHTPEEAEATAGSVVARVRADVAAREMAGGVAPSQRAVVILNPAIPSVYEFAGSSKRAMVAVLVMAFLVGLLLNGLLSRRLCRAEERKHRAVRHPDQPTSGTAKASMSVSSGTVQTPGSAVGTVANLDRPVGGGR